MSYWKNHFITRIFHLSFILCDLKSALQQRTHYLYHFPIFFLLVNLYLLLIFLFASISFEIWILGHWDCCDVASAQLHFIFSWKTGKYNGSMWTTKIICCSLQHVPKKSSQNTCLFKRWFERFCYCCMYFPKWVFHLFRPFVL